MNTENWERPSELRFLGFKEAAIKSTSITGKPVFMVLANLHY